MRHLCSLKANAKEKLVREVAYLVNKHLFYFFIALYGGGPALV